MNIISKDQDRWNFIFSVLFLIFVGVLARTLGVLEGRVPTSIPLFDFFLIVLATFRLIRLFVYDKITQFFRDWFIDAERGPRKTIYGLLTCPWCLGIWAAMVITFFYFLSPVAWLFILVLAVSGLASLVQLFANGIGWRAENLKMDAQGKGTQVQSSGSCGVN